MGLYDFALFNLGAVISALTVLGTMALLRHRAKRKAMSRRRKAVTMLISRGLIPHMYLPAAGEADTELRAALTDVFEAGYLVLTADGHLAGKVYTRDGVEVSSLTQPPAHPTSPALRLVSSR